MMMEDRPNTRSCRNKESLIDSEMQNHTSEHLGIYNPVCFLADEGKGDRHNARAQFESLKDSSSSKVGHPTGEKVDHPPPFSSRDKQGQKPYIGAQRGARVDVLPGEELQEDRSLE